MKKVIFLLLVLSLFVTPIAQAKSISELKIIYSDNINQKCGVSESGYEQVRSCYVQELLSGWEKPTYTIYLNRGLPKEVLSYVFLYSFAHFLMYNTAESEVRDIFHPAPEKLQAMGNDIKAYAAERFITWFYNGDVGNTQSSFFKKILTNIP